MAVTNTNVFDASKRFIDLAGLDLFWDKAKSYIDGVDNSLSGRIDGVVARAEALEATVNGTTGENAVEGLVQKVATLRSEVDALGTGAGSVSSQIQSAINALDLPNTYDAKGAAAAAESAAKAHADGLNTAMDTRVAALEGVKDDYKAADEAQAVVLKKYADDAVAVEKGRAEAAEAGLQGEINGLKGLVGETSVDAQIKDAIQSFSETVTDNQTVDTFAEVITYISTHGGEYNDLVADVAKKAYASDVYTKTQVDDALGLKANAADVYTSTVVDEKLALKANAADVYTKAEVDSTIAGVNGEIAKKANAADVYTKAEVDGTVSTLEGKIADAEAAAKAAATEALKSYYTSAQVDTKLADYYTSAQVDTKLADYYKKSETYSKTEVDNAFSTKLAEYYKKGEIDTKISEAQAADQAYARAYTDLLFNSVVFASVDEINGIF